jgi:nucleoside-diphosphate-sugar epimerase
MDAAAGDGRAFNIGRGHNLSVNRIADLIGGSTSICSTRPGDAHDTLADISAAREILGWEPQVATEDAVRTLARLHA